MILVTGGAGVVGSHIGRRLVSEGEKPRAVGRNPEQAKQRLPAAGVEVVQGDTTRRETLDAAMQGVDTVIHAAFITAERKQGPGVNYYATNVEGTANVVS